MVYEIEKEVFGDDKFDLLLLRDLVSHSLLFLVLEDPSTDSIVGFCILLEIEREESHKENETEPAVHIVNVAMKNSHRNRGWGRILVQYCLNEAANRGYTRADSK